MKRKATILALLTLAALIIVSGASGLIANASAPAGAAPSGAKSSLQQPTTGKPVVNTAVKSDVSQPLRNIRPVISEAPSGRGEVFSNLDRKLPSKSGPPDMDTVIQTLAGPLAAPTPIVNFEGTYNYWGVLPPDTIGDVGRNHYVQMVNLGFQIFDKQGASLYGPANTNTLFSGFGGACETTNSGDPIVVYDPLADRWLLSQFTAVFGGVGGTDFVCFAISTSPDPTGSYYRYQFASPENRFPDYFKVSVWPDAYYMSTREFAPSYVGLGAYALERDRMLVGDPMARSIYFHLDPAQALSDRWLPSDVDGAPPPVGSPNYFMVTTDDNPTDAILIREFRANFANPAASTFNQVASLPTEPFDGVVCATRACIPQPGTTIRLDSLTAGGTGILWRLAYRNLGTHQSLVMQQTVDLGSERAGLRWYEVRNPGSGATIFQQGTFGPSDTDHRWMGSIAMDRVGNIALGYSISSATRFPSIFYTGRLVTDPPGTLPQGETALINGTGSQTSPANRWGDYSAMSVDPTDECTFWYTTEYLTATGERSWRTRIGSFRFPSCTAAGTATPVATATGAVPTATRTALPSATPCATGNVVTGALTSSDPTLTGRLGRNGVRSSCTTAKPCPGAVAGDTFVRNYDSYNYTNTTGATQCVTVKLDNLCGNNTLLTAAYSGTFNPASLCTNFLADPGESAPSTTYAFSVPAGGTYTIVVSEQSGGVGCPNYRLSVNPCEGGVIQTPTTTPQVTPTVCVQTYQPITSTGTLIPATNNIGNACDDCTTTINLPFPVTVYGTSYITASASSNGNVQFASNDGRIFSPPCLPVVPAVGGFRSAVFAFYDDLRTDVMTATHGIYTATVGTAPNRQFVIRWNATFFADPGEAEFEVVLTENSPVLSVIYGASRNNGVEAAAGVQLDGTRFTQYSCQTAALPSGLRIDYVPTGCGITPTSTVLVPTNTPTVTGTPPTATPNTLYGLTTSNRLVKFNSNNPGSILGDVQITGVVTGEQVMGIDFRPATGQLYGLGSTSRLYTINPDTGAAAQVGTGVLSPTLQGAEFGFDFNPVVDRIRIVSDQRQDLRVHPDTLAVTVDGTLTYSTTDPFSTTIPVVAGAAYSNNFSGTVNTTLYDIDTNGFRLVIQNPPNSGTLNTVGSLDLGTAASPLVGFDIVGANTAYATFNTIGGKAQAQGGTAQLYRVTLSNASTVLVGTIGNGLELRGLAAGPGGATAVTPTTTPTITAVPMATLYAVTTSNRLLKFQASNPQVIETNVQITGVFTNEQILGIDFRPATGQLYGLGSTSRLYTINPATGAAAQVSTGVLSPTLQGLEFGFDFNPVVDRIRIVSDQRQDLRVHPDTLAVTVDGTLTYSTTDPFSTTIPLVAGAAYANSFPGALATTLYDIDTNGYRLVTQNPPNAGTLNTVGPLGVSVSPILGFDIVSAGDPLIVNVAFAAFMPIENSPQGGGSKLYTVNLTTGAATLIGTIGTSEQVRGLAGALGQTPATVTPVATATSTVCPFQFTDVPPTNTFYTFVRCLACRGIVGGYSDGTYRPNNQVTRGQLSKIVSNSAGFSEPAGAQIFEDVLPTNPFYQWINRLARRGMIGGYPCGSPGEPCVAPGNRPYFRPFANATRGQISKIISNAAGFMEPVGGQFFEDVPPTNPFYEWIQRLATRGIMGGYPCGSPGEPCVPPGNRPYFRWTADSTRGQTAKIAAGAFFPNCQTPAGR